MTIDQSKTYLITGSAGFIGFHLSQYLLSHGARVVGLDNLNDYYSVELKKARNTQLLQSPRYEFHLLDLKEKGKIADLFQKHSFESVFHLAAQAGVRYSLENPWVYLQSNMDGTLAILEAARHSTTPPHLLMASSSSVYGLSKAYPFKETDSADLPVALYGATKRANELMAHSYSHLFGLRTTLLRFFTVYGPWGRPDMALFKFVRSILNNEEIEVYNGGDMIRDFTYVNDIVQGMIGLESARKQKDQPLYDVFNIGCSEPRTLMEFIEAIESAVGKKAKKKFLPFQSGDVYKTFADVSKLSQLTGYQPKTSIQEGINSFVQWYREFYKV